MIFVQNSLTGPRRKQAVMATGPAPSLNDLARELGENDSVSSQTDQGDLENNNIGFNGETDDTETDTYTQPTGR